MNSPNGNPLARQAERPSGVAPKPQPGYVLELRAMPGNWAQPDPVLRLRAGLKLLKRSL
jgi:hypothetical protein